MGIDMELVEISSPDESDPFMILAASEDSKSIMKFKIGAVILKRGRILGFGHNSTKTHPHFGSKKQYMTMHSEGAALYCAKKLGNDTKGATMIVYRRNGRLARPCESCQRLIEKAGIAKVIYTNNETGSISEA